MQRRRFLFTAPAPRAKAVNHLHNGPRVPGQPAPAGVPNETVYLSNKEQSIAEPSRAHLIWPAAVACLPGANAGNKNPRCKAACGFGRLWTLRTLNWCRLRMNWRPRYGYVALPSELSRLFS